MPLRYNLRGELFKPVLFEDSAMLECLDNLGLTVWRLEIVPQESDRTKERWTGREGVIPRENGLIRASDDLPHSQYACICEKPVSSGMGECCLSLTSSLEQHLVAAFDADSH